MGKKCSHQDQINAITPSAEGCQDCLESGSEWVHLRTCLICGHTGCCDSSVNQHARNHFNETGHPLIISAEAGEDWRWCYIDEVYL